MIFHSSVHLVRVYARVQRVVNNMQNAEKRVGQELLPEERRDAKEDIRSPHRESFQEEYKALAVKKQVATLNPHLDDQDISCSDSRLRFA